LTTKMLASTVQFSRYGRSPSCRRGVHSAEAVCRPTVRRVRSANTAPDPLPDKGLCSSL
jgi:hypothetical protein